MQKLFNVGMLLFIGTTFGMLLDSRLMANDEEYHDYWMKRCKKKTE